MINLGWVINARAMASICCEMFFWGGKNAEKSGKPEGHIGIDVRGWCLRFSAGFQKNLSICRWFPTIAVQGLIHYEEVS